MILGICECNKWGIAPKTFNESKHFLKCPSCSKPMYLITVTNPEEIALRDKDKVEITDFIRHRG